jgi:hypothetical protein
MDLGGIVGFGGVGGFAVVGFGEIRGFWSRFGGDQTASMAVERIGVGRRASCWVIRVGLVPAVKSLWSVVRRTSR